MNGFCTCVLDRAAVHPSFGFNEKSDKLNISEICTLDPSDELQRVQIADNDVTLWLSKDTAYENGFSALLRLVWIPLHKGFRPWQLDIRKSSIDAVLENFEIEQAYRYSFTSPASFATIPICGTDDPDTRMFSLCMPDLFALAWKHSARSGRTVSVCWADDWISEAMHHVMSRQKRWARHPLFLALVASVMLGYLLDRDLDREAKSIAAVENRTRYHGFKHTSVGIAKGDYVSLSQRMSGCAVSMAGLERISKVLNEFLGDICFHAQRYFVSGDPCLRGVNLELDECVETLKKRLKMQKIQIDYLSRRVQVQLTAVSNPVSLHRCYVADLANPLPTQLFNLIAQKEAKVGIAVAEDSRTLASASKEDATAMKTLAAVTVAFLPGTFVAAFFAMPLFQWDAASDGMVVSKRFWVYWAVTIPLTVLTLVVWVLWTRRQAKVHRVSEERAREELWVDIEGERSGRMEGKEGKV